jgi:hypothetical protein
MPREPSHGFSSIGEIFLLTFPFIESLTGGSICRGGTPDSVEYPTVFREMRIVQCSARPHQCSSASRLSSTI